MQCPVGYTLCSIHAARRWAMGAKRLLAAGVALAAVGGVTTGAVGSLPHQQTEKVPAGVVAAVPGGALYKQYCASCHGESGRGDGIIAPHLRRPPTDLTRFALQNKGIFPADRLARIIDGREVQRTHGKSDMPVWGDAFKNSSMGGDEETLKERIRALVKYIESIQERTTNGGTTRGAE
jgi:mono/diheme cytochrome c family protein